MMGVKESWRDEVGGEVGVKVIGARAALMNKADAMDAWEARKKCLRP
jgi:hypothetical protein